LSFSGLVEQILRLALANTESYEPLKGFLGLALQGVIEISPIMRTLLGFFLSGWAGQDGDGSGVREAMWLVSDFRIVGT
jgi:hypothetical protein